MKKYNELAHPKGETLTEEQRVYRVRVVTAFLKTGVPLNKLDNFRDLLEDGGYRLTSSTHMRQLIPFVLKEEEEGIKAEISGSKIAVIFAKSLNGQELARELISVLVQR